MSLDDGDNIRYNNALQQQNILEIETETAIIRREAAKLELERQKILLQRARNGE